MDTEEGPLLRCARAITSVLCVVKEDLNNSPFYFLSCVQPPPIAKRQRLDEDSFARVPHKAKTALHDDYYEREHEEEEEETYGEEGRTTTQDEQLRGREREESSTSFGLPKPSRTDKRPSSALPSDSEPSAPSTFISPIGTFLKT
jgi:hypothetical protein